MQANPGSGRVWAIGTRQCQIAAKIPAVVVMAIEIVIIFVLRAIALVLSDLIGNRWTE